MTSPTKPNPNDVDLAEMLEDEDYGMDDAELKVETTPSKSETKSPTDQPHKQPEPKSSDETRSREKDEPKRPEKEDYPRDNRRDRPRQESNSHHDNRQSDSRNETKIEPRNEPRGDSRHDSRGDSRSDFRNEPRNDHRQHDSRNDSRDSRYSQDSRQSKDPRDAPRHPREPIPTQEPPRQPRRREEPIRDRFRDDRDPRNGSHADLPPRSNGDYREPMDVRGSRDYRDMPRDSYRRDVPEPPMRGDGRDSFHTRGDYRAEQLPSSNYSPRDGRYRDARPDARQDSRQDPRHDARPDARQDVRPDARHDARPDPRQDARQDSRQDSRQDARQDARHDTRQYSDLRMPSRDGPYHDPRNDYSAQLEELDRARAEFNANQISRDREYNDALRELKLLRDQLQQDRDVIEKEKIRLEADIQAFQLDSSRHNKDKEAYDRDKSKLSKDQRLLEEDREALDRDLRKLTKDRQEVDRMRMEAEKIQKNEDKREEGEIQRDSEDEIPRNSDSQKRAQDDVILNLNDPMEPKMISLKHINSHKDKRPRIDEPHRDDPMTDSHRESRRSRSPHRPDRDATKRKPIPEDYQEPGNTKYKTQLCKKYEAKGYCEFEHRCQFAHGSDELRSLDEASQLTIPPRSGRDERPHRTVHMERGDSSRHRTDQDRVDVRYADRDGRRDDRMHEIRDLNRWEDDAERSFSHNDARRSRNTKRY